MKQLAELSIIYLLAIGQSQLLGASASSETQSFSTASGDTLIIQSNYGRVLVRGASDSQLQARIRKIASTEERLDKIQVVSKKKKTKFSSIRFSRTTAPSQSTWRSTHPGI